MSQQTTNNPNEYLKAMKYYLRETSTLKKTYGKQYRDKIITRETLMERLAMLKAKEEVLRAVHRRAVSGLDY